MGVCVLLLPFSAGQHEKQQQIMTTLSGSPVTSAKSNQHKCTTMLESERARERESNQEMSNKSSVTVTEATLDINKYSG